MLSLLFIPFAFTAVSLTMVSCNIGKDSLLHTHIVSVYCYNAIQSFKCYSNAFALAAVFSTIFYFSLFFRCCRTVLHYGDVPFDSCFFFKYCVVCWHLVRYRSLPQQPHQMHIATANETKVFFPWFCVCFVCSGGLEFNWTAAFVCEHTEHSQYTSFFICLFVECVGWWFLIAPLSKFPRVSMN